MSVGKAFVGVVWFGSVVTALATGFLVGGLYEKGKSGLSALEGQAAEAAKELVAVEEDAVPDLKQTRSEPLGEEEAKSSTSESEAPLPSARIATIARSFEAQTGLEGTADFESRLQSLLGQPESRSRDMEMARVFKEWGKKDGEAAFIAAGQLNGRDGAKMMSVAAGAWAESEPLAAWESLMAASNRGAIPGIDLRPTIQSIASKDLQLGLGLLEDLGGGIATMRWSSALVDLINRDNKFEEALPILKGMESSEAISTLTERLFERWSSKDMDGALASLTSISDEGLAKRSMEGILKGWVRRDAEAAFDFAVSKADDPLVGDAVGTVVGQWLKSATTFESKEIFDRLRGLEIRDQVVSKAYREMAASNPAETLSLIEEMDDDYDRSRLRGSAVAIWSFSDMDGARDYAISNFNDKEMAGVMTGLIEGHLRQNQSVEPLADRIASMEDANDRTRSLIHMKRHLASSVLSLSEGQKQDLEQVLARFPEESSRIEVSADGTIRVKRVRPPAESP